MTRIPFPEHAWPLLRRALEHIAAHPDEFWMEHYVVAREHWDERYAVEEYERTTGRPFPACGTVACLAGRIQIEAGANPVEGVFGDLPALKALGLPIEQDEDEPESWAADSVGDALCDVFQDTTIANYAELRAVLAATFTFPEPLPTVPAGVS